VADGIQIQRRILDILWQSLCGWQNRPDYFDTNDLLLIGDLAYAAKVDPEGLAAAFGEWSPSDICEISCELQRKDGMGAGMLAYLAGQQVPSICDLTEYTKWHEEAERG
jgi:hypothetical protein